MTSTFQWSPEPPPALVQDVCRSSLWPRRHDPQYLDGADVVGPFEGVRRESVPEGVATAGLINARRTDRRLHGLHGLLQRGFREVVAPLLTRARIE